MTNDPSSPPQQDPVSGYAPVPGQAPAPSLFEEQPPPVAEPAVAAAAVVPGTATVPADRVWPNLLWDAIMLFGAIAVLGLLFITGSMGDTFAETGLQLAGVAPVLLLAVALGVSVRAGTINLAVVHLAAMATILYAVVLPDGEALAWLVALGATLGGGVVIALLVVLLRTPAWAASILVAVVSMAVIEANWDWDFYESWPELELTSAMAWLMVAGIAATSIIGGAIAILRPVRRLLTRTSQSVEQTGGTTLATAFTVVGALALSGVLAGVAGILSLAPSGIEISAMTGNAQAFIFLGVTLAIVLLGGTSARGGRGGVIGTVCAAIVMYGSAQLLAELDLGATTTFALPIGLLMVALIVSRVLGGGRRKVIEDEPLDPAPVQPEPMPVYAPAPPAAEAAASMQEQGFVQMPPAHLTPGESAGTVVGDPAMQQYWPAEQSEFQPPASPIPEQAQPQPETAPEAPSPAGNPVSPAAAESAPPGFEQPDPPPDHYQYRPPAQ